MTFAGESLAVKEFTVEACRGLDIALFTVSSELAREYAPQVAANGTLVIDDSSVGAISIFATLNQKARFVGTDYELFKLLGHHAAIALVGASLFDQTGRKLPGAESFRDLSV